MLHEWEIYREETNGKKNRRWWKPTNKTDWEKQFSLALFGDHARRIHDHDGTCETYSTCSDLYALKIIDEALAHKKE